MLATSSIHFHATPLGEIVSVWTEQGLYRLCWGQPNRNDLENESSHISSTIQRQIKNLDKRLDDFFRDGQDVFLDVQVDPTGWTPFQRRVYENCRMIQAGSTRTYKELAAMAGSENASRAVGAAMARNRVPLVIPCHRVISTDGQLRGFSAPGGLDTKRFLLDLEKSASQ